MNKTIPVSSHLRKIRRGYTRVNPHTRTIHITIKAKKKGIITPENKQILALLSTRPTEYGGELDFNKSGKLERYTTHIGHKREIKNFPDFEATWHTHPPGKNIEMMHSPDDVNTLLQSNLEQASLVLQDGKSIGLIKTNRAKKWYEENKKDSLNKIRNIFNYSEREAKNALNISQLNTANYDQFLNKFRDIYTKRLEQIGFMVLKYPKGDSKIILPIRPFEPKKGSDIRVRGSVRSYPSSSL